MPHSLTTIAAKTIPEAWFLGIQAIMDNGHEYQVERGSHVGGLRKELFSTTIQIEYPGARPLVPSVPDGVPPPTDMKYIENYLPYLMTSSKAANELYTYGEDIDKQLPELLRVLREGGSGTNQACMSIGGPGSIFLEHSQCLRVIDTRILDDKLVFFVYFRSWDMWGGLPSNLAAIQLLKEYVASELDIGDGELIAYSKGLHLYSHQWDVANMVLKR